MFTYRAMHGAGAWVLAVSGPQELEEGCHCPGPNLHISCVRSCWVYSGHGPESQGEENEGETEILTGISAEAKRLSMQKIGGGALEAVVT